MKLEKLIDALYRKLNSIKANNDSSYEPQIEIYVTPRFLHECMNEIKGHVPPYAYELANSKTIHGYKVWTAQPFSYRDDRDEHPDFRIVNIDA